MQYSIVKHLRNLASIQCMLVLYEPVFYVVLGIRTYADASNVWVHRVALILACWTGLQVAILFLLRKKVSSPMFFVSPYVQTDDDLTKLAHTICCGSIILQLINIAIELPCIGYGLYKLHHFMEKEMNFELTMLIVIGVCFVVRLIFVGVFNAYRRRWKVKSADKHDIQIGTLGTEDVDVIDATLKCGDSVFKVTF